ncbi:hypothetical protein CDD83_5190 [Cordyceps sp. RAO-2017]|nr:hypothetical protein CDD83_5190 [Cordyceps sp. RAO-2017]
MPAFTLGTDLPAFAERSRFAPTSQALLSGWGYLQANNRVLSFRSVPPAPSGRDKVVPMYSVNGRGVTPAVPLSAAQQQSDD